MAWAVVRRVGLALSSAALLAAGCTGGADPSQSQTAATFATQSGSGDTLTTADTGATSGSASGSDSSMSGTSGNDSQGDDTGPGGSSGMDGSTGGGPGACESTLVDSSCDTPGTWTLDGCNPYDPMSCGAGSKCGPFSYDADDNVMTATSCGAIPATPAALGQPCTVSSTPLVWTDSCAQGLMCEVLEEGSADGTCVQMCGCGPDDPTCPAGQLCQGSSMFPGLNICRDACDPLNPSCGAGEACYPIEAGVGVWEWMCFAVGTLPLGSACPGFDCDATGVCSRGSCLQVCDLDAPAGCAVGQCQQYIRPAEDLMPLQPATACFGNVGVCVP